MGSKKIFLGFKEAREIVRKMGFSSERKYRSGRKNYKISTLIPCNPREYYDEWKGYGDWLGNRIYVSFQEVKELVRKLGIKSASQWYGWAKTKDRPKNVPVGVSRVYKDEWKGWYDFFGKKPKDFLSYRDAVRLMRKLNIISEEQYYKLDREEYDLPCHPEDTYKKQWKNWSEFLGTDRRNKNRTYTLNHDYFKKWSNDNAYILGIWFADGCIRDSTLTLTLHKDDKYLLQQILKKLGSDSEAIKDKGKNTYTMGVHSIDMAKSVVKIFKKDKKYLRHNFPKVPQKYLPDFIRGFWDGDGTVYQSIDGNNYKSYRSSLACAHLGLLKQTHRLLKKNIKCLRGHIGKTIQPKGKMVCGHPLQKESVVYGLCFGTNDTRRLRDFMYSTSSDLKMLRKYKKFMAAGKIYLAPEDRRESYWGFYVARNYVRNLNIKTIKEWNKYCASGDKPEFIPAIPKRIYKEWRGYKNWFGIERKYLSFYQAREIIRNMDFRTINDWYKYLKSDKYRRDVPTHPDRVYKEQWRGHCDWIGNRFYKMLPFKDAREFVRKLKLKNCKAWREFARSDKRPHNIPFNPDYTYKNKGYKNIKDWLGTK